MTNLHIKIYFIRSIILKRQHFKQIFHQVHKNHDLFQTTDSMIKLSCSCHIPVCWSTLTIVSGLRNPLAIASLMGYSLPLGATNTPSCFPALSSSDRGQVCSMKRFGSTFGSTKPVEGKRCHDTIQTTAARTWGNSAMGILENFHHRWKSLYYQSRTNLSWHTSTL